ncbi:MAG: MT-A70 family methyltransferase [Pseudonocardiaceae bacterium]
MYATKPEHLLLGTRGKAPVLFRGQGTWLYAPTQEHSHKPEEQYAIIQRSPGPYLELFARRKHPGWHVWGNEITCDIALWQNKSIDRILLPRTMRVLLLQLARSREALAKINVNPSSEHLLSRAAISPSASGSASIKRLVRGCCAKYPATPGPAARSIQTEWITRCLSPSSCSA